MEPSNSDLESLDKTLILDNFTLKSPQDAVRWLLHIAAPQKTSNDEITPGLELTSAFMTAQSKRKQEIIIHLIEGFGAIPACERVKITRLAMDLAKAFLALKSAVVQDSQGESVQLERNTPTSEHVQLESVTPTSKMPDLKPLVTLIDSGVVDTAMLSNMVQCIPEDKRGLIIESVKAAAVEQGLSESAMSTLTQVAEQPLDVESTSTADPKLVSERAKQTQRKIALMKKIADDLPQILLDGRLVQAAKVAVLQTGVLKFIKCITELITELDHQGEAGGTHHDEREELENLVLEMSPQNEDSRTKFFAHKTLIAGGYADQLFKFSRALWFAYQYIWLFFALPLLEMLLSLILSHCAVPLWAWLLFDSVLWLVTAGAAYYIYTEYCHAYAQYQAIEESKLAEGTGVPLLHGASSNSESFSSMVKTDTRWKIGLAGICCMIALLIGWAAMLVGTIEILISFFVSCSFTTVVVSLLFDAVRITTLAMVGHVGIVLYKEYNASFVNGSNPSSAGNYGSFEEKGP